MPRPDRASLLVAALGALGAVVSAYLTSVHYEDVPLACARTGPIDCVRVLHSSYASVGSVPVSGLGLAWFAAMLGLALTGRLRTRTAVAGAVAGGLGVVWFVYVELVQLRAICLWCTVAHVAIAAILAAVLVAASTPARRVA